MNSGTVFKANVTQTEQNSSIDKMKDEFEAVIVSICTFIHTSSLILFLAGVDLIVRFDPY